MGILVLFRPRFNLRFVLVLALAVAIVLRLVVVPLVQAHSYSAQQQDLAQKIEKLGGTAKFDYAVLGNWGLQEKVLALLLGVDKVVAVSVIDLSHTHVRSADLMILSQANRLIAINLDFTDVDDRIVDTLSVLRHLDVVGLRGTKVSTIGIDRLRQKRPEVTVYWDSTPITAQRNGN